MVLEKLTPMITSTDLNLDRLTTEAIDALWAEIRPVYATHFDYDFGPDYLSVKCRGAASGRIRVLRADGQPVGVMLMFRHELVVEDERVILYRASAAVVAEQRNRNNLNNFMFANIIPQYLSHRGQRQYIVEGFIDPAPFSVTHKSLAQAYPCPGVPTPPDILALLTKLRDADLIPGYSFCHDNPFLADYPGRTMPTEAEAERWREKSATDEHVRFFFDQGMGPGRALICIVPVTVTNIVASLTKIGIGRVRRQVRRLRPEAGWMSLWDNFARS